jgi:hypothetical protein
MENKPGHKSAAANRNIAPLIMFGGHLRRRQGRIQQYQSGNTG